MALVDKFATYIHKLQSVTLALTLGKYPTIGKAHTDQ